MAIAIKTETKAQNHLRRLIAKTNKHGPGGCWLWTGRIQKNGYGRMWDGVGQGYTHRMSYELHCGPVPERLLVLHRCDVRHCVNPEHLFTGTQKENLADRDAKGRQNYARGERIGASKLSPDQVLDIRRQFSLGRSKTSLGRGFNVCTTNIAKIVSRKTWTHI